jgi:uncharacterized protein (TIGR03435 family)
MTKALTAAIVMIAGLGAFAADREFEVSSIRPADFNTFARPLRIGPSTFEVRTNLKELVAIACDVQNYQVTGGPSWVETQRYDVTARTEAPATRDEIRGMLAQLLKSRFQLQWHRESQNMSVLVLTVARNGSKLTASQEGTPRDGRGAIQKDLIGVFAHGASMSLFTRYLTGDLGQPVLDKTGLDGIYDFTLKYDSSDAAARFGSIFTALSGVGLKLESRKEALPVIVIDRAEHPSEN